jgi:hypothetical protein
MVAKVVSSSLARAMSTSDNDEDEFSDRGAGVLAEVD